MSGCGNNNLCNDDCVTDRAVLTLGESGCGTGCCNRCVDLFGVTKCCNDLLCNENLVTDGTVATLGESGCGTGCCNRCVDLFGVTKCCNDLLCNENLVTDGTVLTLGESGLGTGGCYSCIDDLGVSGCGNNGLFDQYESATLTVPTLGESGLGTGGCDCIIDDLLVSDGEHTVIDGDPVVLSISDGNESVIAAIGRQITVDGDIPYIHLYEEILDVGCDVLDLGKCCIAFLDAFEDPCMQVDPLPIDDDGTEINGLELGEDVLLEFDDLGSQYPDIDHGLVDLKFKSLELGYNPVLKTLDVQLLLQVCDSVPEIGDVPLELEDDLGLDLLDVDSCLQVGDQCLGIGDVSLDLGHHLCDECIHIEVVSHSCEECLDVGNGRVDVVDKVDLEGVDALRIDPCLCEICGDIELVDVELGEHVVTDHLHGERYGCDESPEDVLVDLKSCECILQLSGVELHTCEDLLDLVHTEVHSSDEPVKVELDGIDLGEEHVLELLHHEDVELDVGEDLLDHVDIVLDADHGLDDPVCHICYRYVAGVESVMFGEEDGDVVASIVDEDDGLEVTGVVDLECVSLSVEDGLSILDVEFGNRGVDHEGSDTESHVLDHIIGVSDVGRVDHVETCVDRCIRGVVEVSCEVGTDVPEAHTVHVGCGAVLVLDVDIDIVLSAIVDDVGVAESDVCDLGCDDERTVDRLRIVHGVAEIDDECDLGVHSDLELVHILGEDSVSCSIDTEEEGEDVCVGILDVSFIDLDDGCSEVTLGK